MWTFPPCINKAVEQGVETIKSVPRRVEEVQNFFDRNFLFFDEIFSGKDANDALREDASEWTKPGESYLESARSRGLELDPHVISRQRNDNIPDWMQTGQSLAPFFRAMADCISGWEPTGALGLALLAYDLGNPADEEEAEEAEQALIAAIESEARDRSPDAIEAAAKYVEKHPDAIVGKFSNAADGIKAIPGPLRYALMLVTASAAIDACSYKIDYDSEDAEAGPDRGGSRTSTTTTTTVPSAPPTGTTTTTTPAPASVPGGRPRGG